MTDGETTALSQKSHEAGHCGGYMDITDHPQKRGRLQLPIMKSITRNLDDGVLFPEYVEPMMAELSATNLHETVQHLSSYHNRYYRSETGVEAAHWIKSAFETYATGRSDVTVTLVSHGFDQPSVVARIQGSGPNANEIVVIGGHEDSIQQSFFGGGDGPAPGADDNASGTATVLEVFRAVVQSGFRPNRTLEFMTYAGEEKGLLGSQDIAETYRNEHKQVVGAMQFDMTMFPASTRKITFITDHVDADLTRFTQNLVDRYVQFPWQTSRCGYACSDHASWTSAGYASVFPFEAAESEMNSNIHTTRDLQSILDADFGLHFAKTGLAFAIEMAGPATW
jgi:leucyl aminopeptidase